MALEILIAAVVESTVKAGARGIWNAVTGSGKSKKPESFEIVCPHCAQQMKVRAYMAGETAPCKYCAEVFTIPSP